MLKTLTMRLGIRQKPLLLNIVLHTAVRKVKEIKGERRLGKKKYKLSRTISKYLTEDVENPTGFIL
jgi:hypothetical protein